MADAMDGTRNLVKWKPGQSGNPAGHSKGRRRAKRLREALDTILEQDVPEEYLERIDERTRASLPDGVTFSEIIALRLALIAATGSRPGDILAASSLILGAQAKPDDQAPPKKIGPPRLPSTEERRRAVASQLGLDPEDETTIH